MNLKKNNYLTIFYFFIIIFSLLNEATDKSNIINALINNIYILNAIPLLLKSVVEW